MSEVDLCLTWKDHLDVLSVSERVEVLFGLSRTDVRTSTLDLQQRLYLNDLVKVRSLFSTHDRAGDLNLRVRGADGRIRCCTFLYARETTKGVDFLSLRLSEPAGTPSAETRMCATEMLAMLDRLDQCACVKDRNHIIRSANRSFCALLARDENALVGMTDYDLFPEDYADKSYEAEEAAVSGVPAGSFSVQTRNKAGEMRAFENRTLPVKSRAATPEWVCSVVTDTTAQVIEARKLRIAEESLFAARQRARMGDFVVDVKAETWTASDLMYEILGLDRDCASAVPVWIDLILPADFARLGTVWGEVVTGQSAGLDCEIRFVRQSDKALRWGHVRGQLDRDSLGHPAELRGTIEDITERKAAQASERRSSGLLEMFVRDAPGGLAMFDRELRYMVTSQRWIDEREGGNGNPVGRLMYDLHPEIPDALKREHGLALHGETIPYREIRYEDERGREHWVWRMVQPWREGDGTIGGIVILSEEITARKKSETALRASEESLREAQQIARIGSYTFDIRRDEWTSSDALDEIYGIGPSYGRSMKGWLDLVHPEDRQRMAAHAKNEVVERGAPFDREYRIIRVADSAVRWVHGLGRVEVDEKGEPRILRGTIQDITARKQADASLIESQAQLQLFTEHAPAAIAMFDCQMRYLAVSRRWMESFALGDGPIVGRSHYDVFPDLPERWKEAHRRGLAGEGIRMEEDLFQRADGRKQWIHWELLPWYKSDASLGGIVLFTEDITALKESAERLQLAASVFTHTSESIVITDTNGDILDVNEAFTRIYGYAREEVLGKNPRLLNSGRQPREFYTDMWAQLKETGQWSGEIWNRSKSGQILPGMMTISSVPDEAGRTKQYVGLFSDLSPVKEREQQLKQLAYFDALTGLPNRTLLADRLRQGMAQARRMGRLLVIAYLDFDDFTALNDRHGRTIGDQVMTSIVQRMNTVLRDGDTLARLGGDEFAVVLLGLADTEEGLRLVGRLLDIVAEPVQINDLALHLSASIGIAFYPQADEIEPDQLVRQADQAMYFAKLAGKSRCHVFDPMLDRSMRGRHEDLHRIRQALQAEEFELYFQPKVNMRTGEMLGAEALIRWRHPELGVLPPEHFLPVMEGNMLIVELGNWVLARAMAQIEEWRSAGIDVSVSVNVDAMQLQEPGFADRLARLLRDHPAVHPSKLELEVLESSAFQDVSQVSEVIRACRKLGVSFALDDFGTGYSSLSYLKRLPVDVLKIDRSFVHDMLDDPEDLTILEGVLVLANAFRLRTIAEGVETVEHGLMLLRRGCQVGQGYQIARPMRAGELPTWVANWRPNPQWMRVSEIDQAQWPILHAGVEHRAWTLEFEDFIRNRRASPPAMDAHLCRLGSWLDAEKSAGRGDRPGIRAIDELHQRLHLRADDLLRSKPDGDSANAALVELHGFKDKLVESLQNYVAQL